MKTAEKVLCGGIFCVAAGYGQTITGDLVVNVTDSSGGVVSAAALSLTAVETNVKLSAVTGTLGTSPFNQIKPGHYRLGGSAPGFQKTNNHRLEGRPRPSAHRAVQLTLRALQHT